MSDAFSHLRTPPKILAMYPPDRDGLFEMVRALTTDKMLRVIAEGDYGDLEDEHFEALKKLRDGVNLDRPLEWVPNEVLSLYRWSEYTKGSPLSSAQHHVARAFSCCALINAPDVHDNRSIFDNDAIAPLIQSCFELGKPLTSHLIRLITWLLENIDLDDPEYLFQAFGLVVVVAYLHGSDSELFERLGTWMISENEKLLAKPTIYNPHGARTFLDVHFASTSPERWVQLTDDLRKRLPPESSFTPFLTLIVGRYGR